MRRLLIEPLDVLMFRSERPFIARESSVAKLGVITPLTFEGAIKSKVFLKFCEKKKYSPSDFQRKKNEDEKIFKERIKGKMEKDEELKKVLEVIGHPAVNTKSFIQVLGVFFSRKEEKKEWFPIPNDIVRKDNKNGEILKLIPVLKEEVKIPKTESYTCFSTYSKIKEKKGLISFNALVKYLLGDKPDKSQIIENPYGTESRTGIRLERETKTTVERHLYTAEFLRLKDWKENWCFIIWYEADGIEKYLKDEEVIRLGGEGRGAICRRIDEINMNEKLKEQELIEEINKRKKFKLYLASPSYFGNYRPPEDKLKEKLEVNDIKLKAALPGKPIYVGGYDFAMNKEKPLRRWVNAGAVYYYEFNGKLKDNLSLPIKLIEKDIDMRCAFIGRW